MLASLRFRLALWLLLPLSLFVAVCGYLAWRHAAAVADYVQDHDLLASAKVLSDRLIWEGDNVQASVPPSALSLFVSPERDRVFLSVTGASGELLAGSPGFPMPQVRRPEGADRAQWYDTRFQGVDLRAVVTTRSMFDVTGARDITIAVGKTTGSRDHMLRSLWWPSVDYLLIALVLAVVLTTVALTLELRPVVRLSQQLAQRDPMHLDFVVDTRALHTELRPVADTINRFVRQLRAHSQAQRRFIADAAHQLRTPLAMQATQIEFARYTRQHRQDWDTRRADMDAMWVGMQASNRRLVDVTNKLLLLAQAEHGDAQAHLEPVDLPEVALRCVEQLAALADRRHIDLGLDVSAAAGTARVRAQPALLDALVTNLLDNALRYTQEGGRVTVGVRIVEQGVELTVEDNGPGIPAEARERVFERFYRVSQDTEGTGLGLAIVREIARAFDATVDLSVNAKEGRGLVVTVRFPVTA
ncbi:sensor histidine kinase [Variovorax sp. N23]|uniref:sensor histidine kinase n=1 Tax=Variovorax sp. N23 TaxID=2980555 RepID=UPI0021CA305E|nr:sensor histidine kinase [Variovorax sp. N23]MCU4119650.1 sensor histidine kinase [Variovorax sp. N23]